MFDDSPNPAVAAAYAIIMFDHCDVVANAGYMMLMLANMAKMSENVKRTANLLFALQFFIDAPFDDTVRWILLAGNTLNIARFYEPAMYFLILSHFTKSFVDTPLVGAARLVLVYNLILSIIAKRKNATAGIK